MSVVRNNNNGYDEKIPEADVPASGISIYYLLLPIAYYYSTDFSDSTISTFFSFWCSTRLTVTMINTVMARAIR